MLEVSSWRAFVPIRRFRLIEKRASVTIGGSTSTAIAVPEVHVRRLVPLLIALSALPLGTARSGLAAGALPTRVGQCVSSRVASIGNRLGTMVGGRFVNQPGSGSAVRFANGGYQVSYDQIPAVDRSRPGDPVSMCLVSLPTGCPKGDDRGKIYRTVNLRTRASWTLPDSEHACGGA